MIGDTVSECATARSSILDATSCTASTGAPAGDGVRLASDDAAVVLARPRRRARLDGRNPYPRRTGRWELVRRLLGGMPRGRRHDANGCCPRARARPQRHLRRRSGGARRATPTRWAPTGASVAPRIGLVAGTAAAPRRAHPPDGSATSLSAELAPDTSSSRAAPDARRHRRPARGEQVAELVLPRLAPISTSRARAPSRATSGSPRTIGEKRLIRPGTLARLLPILGGFLGRYIFRGRAFIHQETCSVSEVSQMGNTERASSREVSSVKSHVKVKGSSLSVS